MVCTRRPIALARSAAVGSGWVFRGALGFGNDGRAASTRTAASSSTALPPSLVNPRASFIRLVSRRSSSRWHSRRNTARSSACRSKSDSSALTCSRRIVWRCHSISSVSRVSAALRRSRASPNLRSRTRRFCWRRMSTNCGVHRDGRASGAFSEASRVARRSSTWCSWRSRMLPSTRSRWRRNAANVAFHSRSNASLRACERRNDLGHRGSATGTREANSGGGGMDWIVRSEGRFHSRPRARRVPGSVALWPPPRADGRRPSPSPRGRRRARTAHLAATAPRRATPWPVGTELRNKRSNRPMS